MARPPASCVALRGPAACLPSDQFPAASQFRAALRRRASSLLRVLGSSPSQSPCSGSAAPLSPRPTLSSVLLPTQVQVVMLCCAIKPLCGWNAEEAATVSRERCGGQGYLSCNKFGAILGFAHAGGARGCCQGLGAVFLGLVRIPALHAGLPPIFPRWGLPNCGPAPPLGSPSSCQPAVGWLLYTVHPACAMRAADRSRARPGPLQASRPRATTACCSKRWPRS